MLSMSVPAKVKYIALSLLFVVASVNSVRTIVSILQSGKRLDDLKGEVAGLEEKKRLLEGQIDYRRSPEYIEKEARNKLNMVKPGEEVYVVRDAEVRKALASAEKRPEAGPNQPQPANYVLWLDLFDMRALFW